MSPPIPPAVLHPMAFLVLLEQGVYGPRTLAGHEDDEDDLGLALATYPGAKSDDLDKLARDMLLDIGDFLVDVDPDGREWSILTAIAANPNISNKTTERLLYVGDMRDDLNRPIAEALGSNPSRLIGRLENPLLSERVDEYVALESRDADQLRELAFHASSDVRSKVAVNPATPVDLLLALARDPDPGVRTGVSENEHTPDEVILALADDPDKDVRFAVKPLVKKIKAAAKKRKGLDSELDEAADPTTPDETLLRLAARAHQLAVTDGKDPLPIYLAVASNPNASALTLSTLISYAIHTDVGTKVLQEIETNPGRLVARLTGGEDEKNLDVMIASRTSNVDTLRELAMSHDEEIRAGVASNPHTPVDLLEALARDPSSDVVGLIAAWAPRLSLATQMNLAQHKSSDVRHLLLLHTEDDDVLSLLIETEPYFKDEDFWWNLKQLPNVTTKHLKAWVKRYNDETGESLTLKEFEEWEP